MTSGPLLSVRGDARRTLPPDLGVIFGSVEARDTTKAEALAVAAAAQRAVIDALTAVGGRPATASERLPLSWVTRQVTTVNEEEYDHQKQRQVLTGRTVARALIEVRIRDLGLVAEVSGALEDVDRYAQHYVHWAVDADNPEWRAVRADAIHAALRQADDYAAALGCRVSRVEQVADAGLLSDQGVVAVAASARGGRMMSAGGPSGGGPELDPVPQEISAVIEVRCSTETTAAVG